jgi:DNA polymerase
MPTKLHLDFETASTVNLKRLGAAAYARHPETRILCLAWAFDDDPVQVWRPGTPFPQAVADHIAHGGAISGWSLQFEFHIWNAKFATPMTAGQLDDTQARAAYHGLPMALADAGKVLKLPIQKDRAGHDLMLRMARPREVVPTLRWWHDEDPLKYDELETYCINDVASERAIDKRLPPLPDRERRIWLADFKANARGIAVDINLVDKLQAVADDVKRDLDREMRRVTKGRVQTTSNVGQIAAYINVDCGFRLEDVNKDTVKEFLEAPYLPPGVREVLALRQAAAKTSAAKLPVLRDAAPPDGSAARIIRGLLAYYGAQRTGRWAGRLFQPQNLPRGVLKPHEVEQAIAILNAGGTAEVLTLLFGQPGVAALDVVITLIRSCLIARPGKRLVVADFSQIEARVIAWLAGQQDVLDVFESGEDVYTHTARAIGSQSRQLGKVLVLACGFQQGGDRFQETAKGYGIHLTNSQAHAAVAAWRQANPKIVDLWWTYQRAAVTVALGPHGTLVTAGKCVFNRRRGGMVIILPSGRELFYHDIDMFDGDLIYNGVNQTTKQWGEIRTYGGKLAENITQAVARDVMCEAILDLPPYLDLLLTIHDELICECDLAQAPRSVDLLLDKMKTTPSWAKGLPVGAAGWTGERYRKG